MKLSKALALVAASVVYAKEAHVGWVYCGHVLLDYDSDLYESQINQSLTEAGFNLAGDYFQYLNPINNSLFVVGSPDTGDKLGYTGTCQGDCLYQKGEPLDKCAWGVHTPGFQCTLWQRPE
ncbi:hypothetical protein FE257_000362 [Aspergillus nanangensis]|uniref:Uncharacterized protein n=1 Tax=Aspergillus nanangensis TaxID=2582783 RepID=A0AAD4CVX1_ASPNN|nr:hypothetical protein FE257_000362 [Aspergillus nanangensis]